MISPRGLSVERFGMEVKMKNREEFTRLLSEQIRCRRAREDVVREVEDHIFDQAQAYEADGMPPEEALAAAVEQMGDPVALGVELDRIHRPRMDWGMLALAVCLSLGGLAVQQAVGGFLEGGVSLTEQCVFTGLGFCMMAGICFLDYSLIGKYAKLLYLFFAGGMYVYLTQLSVTVNGMHRGAILPMYLFVPLYAGVLYQYRKTGWAGLAKSVIFLLLPVWIAWRGIPSLSTALQLFLICGGMLLLAVLRNWFLENRRQAAAALLAAGVCLPLAVFALGYGFWMADYQKLRILAFFDPEAYGSGAGYYYRQVAEVLRRTDWIGGAGNAGELLAQTIPGENGSLLSLVALYGSLAGFLTVFAIAAFVIHAFLVSMKQKNQLGLMIGMGCTLVLGVQTVIGAAVNFGCLPVTTVTLPFLTGGKAAALTYSVLIGLLLSVARNRDVLSDRLSRPGRRSALRLRMLPDSPARRTR